MSIPFILGAVCAGIVLLGAERLAKQIEHQHILILGMIVTGVGTAIYLDISVFLPMLLFGILVRALDRDHKVIAIRIASDTRVFLVVTFVLAGAALDIAYLFSFWREAIFIAIARLLGQLLPICYFRQLLELTEKTGCG